MLPILRTSEVLAQSASYFAVKDRGILLNRFIAAIGDKNLRQGFLSYTPSRSSA